MIETSVLEDRRIKVKPAIHRRGFLPEGHDGEHTYTGCFKDYGLPYDSKVRSFVNPFFNDNEQEEFERLLNKPRGALNIYNFTSKFWGEFSMALTKDGTTLNLNNPTDALFYRIFLVSPRFANTPEDKKHPKCDFYLEDEAVQEAKASKSALLKEEALGYYMKINKSKKNLYNTLRLLNKKPSKDASLEWLKGQVLEIIDEKSARGKVGIQDFIRVSKDPKSTLKLFVLDAIDNGDIVRTPEGLRVKEFNKFLGKHLEEAVDYFDSKDPDVLEMKQIIETRLSN